jgi:hypothetical protein
MRNLITKKTRDGQIRAGTVLEDPLGKRHHVLSRDHGLIFFYPRTGETAEDTRIFWVDLLQQGWYIVRGEEVSHTDNDKKEKKRPENTNVFMDSIRVRATSSYLKTKGRTSVTLTKPELEQLARFIRAGKVLLNDSQSVSKGLRTAMTKLGVDAKGL